MTDQATSCPTGWGVVKKPRRWQRWGISLGVALCLLLVIGELVARFGLGLGDPPLWMDDPQMEYLYQPNQDCRRFGNRFKVNAYSMRSDDFPKQKSDPKEFRVLFVGDSVINGGVLTDQKNLATEILKRELAVKLNRPVVVGNVSAGSWGPPNQLAYLQKYGLFDADVLVLVASDDDIADVPDTKPVAGVRAGYPARRPLLALQEAVTRYVPAIWYRFMGNHPSVDEPPPEPSLEDVQRCGQAVGQIIQKCRAAGIPMIFLMHHERANLWRPDIPWALHWREFWLSYPDVTRMDLRQAMLDSIAGRQEPYMDIVHPNDLGQKLMAQALLQPLIQVAGESAR